MNNKNIRQSNFELLRIISMLMIVAHHFAVHSNFDFTNSYIGFSKFWIHFVQLWGKVGTNIFILITGYFLVTSTKFNIKKIITFWIQVFTYSIILYLIPIVIKFGDFSIGNFTMHLFPISFSFWWFATAYFFLYLFSPFLNKFLNSLDVKTYKKFIVLEAICFCLIPTFLNVNPAGNNFIVLIFVYSIGGYFRLHPLNLKHSPKYYIFIALLIALGTYLINVALDLMAYYFESIPYSPTYLYKIYTLPMLLIAIFIFLGFTKISLKYNAFINLIASATFGVYLIHEEPFIRILLWTILFNVSQFTHTVAIVPISLCIIGFVYIACTVIELLRKWIYDKLFSKWIDRLAKFIDISLEKVSY